MEANENSRAGVSNHQQFNISVETSNPNTTTPTTSAASKFKYDANMKEPHALKASLTHTATSATLTTPSTPRIELSRASSSSHHEGDSRESSPENVFEQVGTGTLQETIGLGFREEGALELRSSTEELFFMDPEQKREEQEKLQQRQQAKRSSPHIFKFDDHQTYLQQHQRKDSASSEVAALLCISGRTSRISSVGSQGSAVSRLSAVSGVSRSPSPHRMLLETSFCGPKPLEDVVDGSLASNIEAPVTADLMEQMLLARKHDPTKAVLAEGINVDSFTKEDGPNTISNGSAKLPAKQSSSQPRSTKKTMGAQRRSTKSPGQMVVGKTPGGTEYIRINLKPDHMYNDKGIGPNERVVEAPNTLAPVYAKGQKKPGSLSLGRNTVDDKCRLTPSSSPQPSRQGSRSPSPATVSVSRKSSFSSLFRFGSGSAATGGKDSPDRERSSSRAKNRDRQQTPQSQNVTPSKQKTVLAIFKTNKRGSSAGADGRPSKSSSPVIDEKHQSRSKSQTPVSIPGTSSRPASRLRYYDEPVEGVIHIPLHTPPEERETQKLLQGIQQLNMEPVRPHPAAVLAAAPSITASQLAAAAAALKPIGSRKDSDNGNADAIIVAPPQPSQIENIQRIESAEMQSQVEDNKETGWSLEPHRSSESRSDKSYANIDKFSGRTVQENGIATEVEIHRLPSVDSTTSMISPNQSAPTQAPEDAVAREKRRLLFATRLGSGSQEQIFSTQFSISKTESLSSQLSEQVPDSIDGTNTDYLHRQDTVIRRVEDEINVSKISTAIIDQEGTLKRVTSIECKSTHRQKSLSTSEDEKPMVPTTTVATVMLRRKSRSTSEEDGDNTQRHSRYLEKFDVRKKYHENVPRKPKRQSLSEGNREESQNVAVETADVIDFEQRHPTLPHPPPPSTTPSPIPVASHSATPPTHDPSPLHSQSQSPVEPRAKTPVKPPRTSTSPAKRAQSITPPSRTVSPPALITVAPAQRHRQATSSVESSESERDSDLAASVEGSSSAAVDPKRRHLPRHLGIIEDHESTGLVSQESFEDELPYVPTTLPEERAQGISIIPMKERVNMELKTYPVDRPRSTTPLNPSHLEEYCAPSETTVSEFIGPPVLRGEKLRISLPRRDPTKEKERDRPQSSKSPRRTSNVSGKSWFEFAEDGLRAGSANLERKDSNKQLLPAPSVGEEGAKPIILNESRVVATATIVQTTQITPTGSTQRKLSGHWIDFENIPEKRKPAKRITTLPRDGQGLTSHSKGGGTANMAYHSHEHSYDPQPDVTVSVGNVDGKIHYNYVKPEDCQCECHEVNRGESAEHAASGERSNNNMSGVKPIKSEDLLPLLDPDTNDGMEPSDSSHEYSCYTDDDADVQRHQTASSYSHSTSSKADEFPRRDVVQASKKGKFPGNRS